MNLARIVEPHPADDVALVSRGQPTTYGALRSQVDGLRGGLAGLGLEAGDRVALLCANNSWFVSSYLAIVGLGCVAVPLNPTSPAAEVERELNAVGARAAVLGPHGAGAFAGIERFDVPTVTAVVAPAGVEVDVDATLDDLVASDPVPIVELQGDDLAVLIFTSGTAGSPKAAMLTHGNLLANIEQMKQRPDRRLRPEDVCLGVLPLFHIFGLNVALGMTLAGGASIILVERFDPQSALQTVADHRCTVLAGAPPMWAAWAAMPGADPDAMAHVRIATSGASKLSEETAQAVEERFGIHINEGYGLTEASPVVTSSIGRDSPRGSIGQPLPAVEVRLVDSDGEDALLGDSGEIWVRGPNVFAGYWEDPEASAAALSPDGWLRTGDVAVSDDRGNLYIVDRAKDLIIVSGFNVYPAEVEEALSEHPGVKAVAVVGVDSPYSGEAVKAYVVAEPGRALEEDELIEFTAQRLARYKCPTKVMFVDQLPEGPAGKMLRRQLRS